MQNEEKKEIQKRSDWVPSRCMNCRYASSYRLHADFPPTNVCGHPKSYEIKGGPNVLYIMDPPTEDCPFLHYEEKYKENTFSNFFLRWFWRIRLRLSKKM